MSCLPAARRAAAPLHSAGLPPPATSCSHGRLCVSAGKRITSPSRLLYYHPSIVLSLPPCHTHTHTHLCRARCTCSTHPRANTDALLAGTAAHRQSIRGRPTLFSRCQRCHASEPWGLVCAIAIPLIALLGFTSGAALPVHRRPLSSQPSTIPAMPLISYRAVKSEPTPEWLHGTANEMVHS